MLLFPRYYDKLQETTNNDKNYEDTKHSSMTIPRKILVYKVIQHIKKNNNQAFLMVDTKKTILTHLTQHPEVLEGPF